MDLSGWDCHPDCPVRRLGEQSGESITALRKGYDNGGEGMFFGGQANPNNTYGDHGTAARFFHQSDWDAEQAGPQHQIGGHVTIINQDVLDWAATYDGPKFHAMLCDPPYHLTNRVPDVKRCKECGRILGGRDGHPQYCPRCGGTLEYQRSQGKRGFMGKKWDGGDIAYRPETWAALAQHLHPGAFGMAFASARGWHRLAVAIEDAGLRIHPSIFGWSYGSGFPKATRIDTQVDKAAGQPLAWHQFARAYDKAVQDSGLSHADIDRHLGIKASSCYWVRLDERGGLPPRHHWEQIHELLSLDGDLAKLYDEAEREVVDKHPAPASEIYQGGKLSQDVDITAPATELAAAWEGHRYGLQALKPALEPIIVFQKPYEGKPVEDITRTGAGALWIDGGRIGLDGTENLDARQRTNNISAPGGKYVGSESRTDCDIATYKSQGRWPANFVLVHHPACRRNGTARVKGTNVPGSNGTQGQRQSAFAMGAQETINHYADADGLETVDAWACHESCPVRRLGEQSGPNMHGAGSAKEPGGWPDTKATWGMYGDGGFSGARYGDHGTAARFFYQAAYELEQADPVFYCAKASRAERDAGLEEMQARTVTEQDKWAVKDRRSGTARNPTTWDKAPVRNPHPTVKPVALAQHLATLLLPPEAYAPRRILIPFAGSGSEGIGAALAGWDEMTLIELDAETCAIAEARLAHWLNEPRQLELV